MPVPNQRPELRSLDEPCPHLSEKLAVAGKQLLQAAVLGIGEGSSRFFKSSQLPQLPPGLREQPEGEVEVPLPSCESGRLECLRDLDRTMEGGSILVLGRRRLYPVRPETESAERQRAGATGSEVCAAALSALETALRAELLDQGYGLSAKGIPLPMLQRRGTLGVDTDLAADDDLSAQELLQKVRESKVSSTAIRALAEEVAVNISVSPGIQVVVDRGLPPLLLQPTYVVCIGGGQVRVLTFAFVGGPVTGERPDTKRTPFSVRLATDDLVPAAAVGRAAAAARPTGAESHCSKVRYAAHVVAPAVQTTLDIIVSLEEELFEANEVGDWKKLAAVEAAAPDQSLEADSRARTESQGWGFQGDISEGSHGLPSGVSKPVQVCRPGRVLAAPSDGTRFTWSRGPLQGYLPAHIPGLPASVLGNCREHRTASVNFHVEQRSQPLEHQDEFLEIEGSAYGMGGL